MKNIFIFLIFLVSTQVIATEAVIRSKLHTNYKLVHAVQPIYPEEARLSFIEGFVGVAYQIDGEGKAVNIWVIEENPEGIFTRSAINAVKQYRWKADRRLQSGELSEPRAVKIRFELSKDPAKEKPCVKTLGTIEGESKCVPL